MYIWALIDTVVHGRVLSILEVTVQKERIVFYASKTEKEALDRISKKSGVPASELLRRALTALLKEKRNG